MVIIGEKKNPLKTSDGNLQFIYIFEKILSSCKDTAFVNKKII